MATDLQELRKQLEARKAQLEQNAPAPAQEDSLTATTRSRWSEIGDHVLDGMKQGWKDFTDYGMAVVSGVIRAPRNLAGTVEQIQTEAGVTSIEDEMKQYANLKPETQAAYRAVLENKRKAAAEVGEKAKQVKEFLPTVAEFEEGSGKETVQDLSSFVATYLLTKKALPGKAATTTQGAAKSLTASALATWMTTDVSPDSKGFVDFLSELKPEIRDTILGELTTKPGDTTFEIRRKRMIEDAVVGLGVEGVQSVVGLLTKGVSKVVNKVKADQITAPIDQADDLLKAVPDVQPKPSDEAIKSTMNTLEQIDIEAKAAVDRAYSVKDTITKQAQQELAIDQTKMDMFERVTKNIEESRRARMSTRGSQIEAAGFHETLDDAIRAKDADRIIGAVEVYSRAKKVPMAQAARTLRHMMERTSPELKETLAAHKTEEVYDPFYLRSQAESYLAQSPTQAHVMPTARERLWDMVNNPSREKWDNAQWERFYDSKREVAVAATQTARAVSMDALKSAQDPLKAELLKAGIGATIGGGIGYEVGDREGAIIGTMLGMTYPFTRRLGTYATRGENWIVDKFGAGLSRPTAKLNVMGDYGQTFSRLMETAERNISTSTGNFISKVHTAVKLVPETQHENLIRVMQGTAKAATPEVDAAAKTLRAHFQGVAKEMHKAGLVDDKQLKNMIEDQKYWPRVYDEALLSSREGREKWIDTFTKAEWSSEEAAMNAIEHILHGSKKYMSQFQGLIEKKGSKYYLRKDAAERLYRVRDLAKIDQKVRAGHLKKRTIFPENEDILTPFLVKDPVSALTVYGEDVIRQIEASRIFGAKDELAESFFRGIENTSSGKNSDFARNVYYQLVHDSRSDMIARGLRMDPKVKQLMGQAHAVSMWKLSLAQVLNAGQTVVNSPVYLAKYNNPAKAFAVTMKQLFKSLPRQGTEASQFAERTGAALESTVMELAGSAHVQHSVAGRELQSSFLEIFNNPTKFLRATGFIWVEQFNRRFAANIGRAIFEDLMDQKALIEAGKITNKKTIARVNAQLYELGMDPRLGSKDITEGMAEAATARAGLALSDTVNYKNSATQMPYLWRHPGALLFRQFKTFTFHHGAFVKENLIKPAVENGNYSPLLVYLTYGAGIGMTVSEARKLINGDDSELSNTEMYLRGLGSIGGAALAYDAAMATTSQYGGDVVSFFGGPTGGMMYKGVQEGKKIAGAAYGMATGETKVGTGMTEAGTHALRMGASMFGGGPGKKAALDALNEQLGEENAGKRESRKGKRSARKARRSER